ncbi:hypothetical protein GCM10009678_82810 [Actinomadura kijaniata]|uniref:Uncharacterized protein n=1 Tax=Actinomadura namibiensis TaxID=182080 RepID=A0A7W3QS85_ACTNM|nr:hypothetical protein [Actinomadura namibiensis]
MTIVSPDARCVLGEKFVAGVCVSDMYQPWRSVVEGGWMAEQGAVLLAAFRRS